MYDLEVELPMSRQRQGISPLPEALGTPGVTDFSTLSYHEHLHFSIIEDLTRMSRAAKLTLAGTSLMAAGTIIFVHYAQQSEKAVSPRLAPEKNAKHIFLPMPLSWSEADKFRLEGNARRRGTRYRAAKGQERAAGGF